VTKHERPTNADSIAVAQPKLTGADVVRSTSPTRIMGVASVVLVIGAVLAFGAYLAMAPLTNATFPFVRVVAMAVLFTAVAGVALVLAGLMWLVRGLIAYVKPPK
jgi:hypothetical protein